MIDEQLVAHLICDSNLEYGSGHVMRQITLGVALSKSGFQVQLLCNEIPQKLRERAEMFGFEIIERTFRQDDLELGSELLTLTGNQDVVIFDGYFFLHQTIQCLFDSGRKVVIVDDNGDLADVPCHVILNQNFHADVEMYKSNESRPLLLLGLEWALIRPEVIEARANQIIEENEGIFISMGGTDPLGITQDLLTSLNQVAQDRVVAAGGFLGGSSLTPLEMATVMSISRVGVIACGTTTWEACYLGLPFVGIVVAENQVLVAESLRRIGFTLIIDCRNSVPIENIVHSVLSLLDDESLCRRLKESGQLLIDGLGAERTAGRILDLLKR